MLQKLAIAMALAAGVSLPLANIAEAAIADSVVGSDMSKIEILPVEKAQFFFGGRNYCWYPNGWQGPGFYWCGYAWRTGSGWGGPEGWHGWHGGGPGGPGGPGHPHVGGPGRPHVAGGHPHVEEHKHP